MFDCIRCGKRESELAGVCTLCREKEQKQKTRELKAWWRSAKKALKAGERVMPPGWSLKMHRTYGKEYTPSLTIHIGVHSFMGGYDKSEHSVECATEHAWGYFGIPMEVLLETCEARFGKAKAA